MKNKNLFAVILIIVLWPICMKADEKKPEINVNERYEVESVEITGKDASKVSQTLRDDAQTSEVLRAR